MRVTNWCLPDMMPMNAYAVKPMTATHFVMALSVLYVTYNAGKGTAGPPHTPGSRELASLTTGWVFPASLRRRTGKIHAPLETSGTPLTDVQMRKPLATTTIPHSLGSWRDFLWPPDTRGCGGKHEPLPLYVRPFPIHCQPVPFRPARFAHADLRAMRGENTPIRSSANYYKSME